MRFVVQCFDLLDDRTAFKPVLAKDLGDLIIVGVELSVGIVHKCLDLELRRRQTFDNLLGKLVVGSSLILLGAIANSQRFDCDSNNALLQSSCSTPRQ